MPHSAKDAALRTAPVDNSGRIFVLCSAACFLAIAASVVVVVVKFLL